MKEGAKGGSSLYVVYMLRAWEDQSCPQTFLEEQERRASWISQDHRDHYSTLQHNSHKIQFPKWHPTPFIVHYF